MPAHRGEPICTPSGAEVMGCFQNLILIHHARLHVYPTLLRRHILCRKHKKSQSENTSTHVRKWSKAYSKETTRETCLC
jgi:hypothetical protein